ncbi:MAG: hypothetical protein P8177_13680, partial [Gemmatimonadota bacterium]
MVLRAAGVCRILALLAIVAVGSGVLPTDLAAQADLRMVLGSGVVCRARPDPGAPVRHRYALGDRVGATEERLVGGVTWYLDAHRVRGEEQCWIYGPLTVEWDRSDRMPALLAAADHVLAREGPVPFAEYVAVDNLLTQTGTRFGEDAPVIDGSPLLQLRRLQVIDRAVGAADAGRRPVELDPLKSAWMFAHRDVVEYYEPAGRWLMAAEVYWHLFDRHRDAPWAEEIAWAAANGTVPGDECYADCLLDRIERTWARYWAEYPRGVHTEAAVRNAIEILEWGAAWACEPAMYDPADVAARIRRIHSTLDAVTVPG